MTVPQVRELQKYLDSLSELMITDNLDTIRYNTGTKRMEIHTHHGLDHYIDYIDSEGKLILDSEWRRELTLGGTEWRREGGTP